MRLATRAVLGAALALALASPGEAVRRRAFVTSVTGTGNLATWPDAGGQAGLAAGDEICRERATAASLPNANAFRAWLSTASTDAYCHVQGLTGHRNPGCTGGPPQAAGPWYRYTFPTSAPVAEGLEELTAPAGVIYRPVLYDEFGTPADSAGPSVYWTGTGESGAVSPDVHCSGWTSAAGGQLGVAGSALGTAQLWTETTGTACGASLRLLCLEPGASEATGQRWSAPGSLAFLTSGTGPGDLGSWPQAGSETGIAAGDAICSTLAAQAHLPAPESFVAWLSDGQQDARDRLTSNGPFRRIDGVPVADSEADLLDGTNDHSIHQFETGAYKTGGAGGEVFTGTLEDGTASTMTCSDWTSAAAVAVTKGSGGTTRSAEWTDNGTTSCSYSQHLYCISNVVTLFWDGFDLTGDTGRWSTVVP